MVDRGELELESKQYDTDREGVPRFQVRTKISADKRTNELDIQMWESPDKGSQHQYGVTATLEDWEQIDEIRSFIERHLSQGTHIEREKTFSIEDATVLNGRLGEMWDGYDELSIRATDKSINFTTRGGGQPYLSFYQESIDGEPQDSKNIKQFLDLLREIGSGEKTPKIHVEFTDKELRSECLPKYTRGDYKGAVSLAGELLEERVREINPKEYDDNGPRDLMQKVFSEDDGPFRFADEDDEQVGIMFLYAGYIAALRNPMSHRRPDPNGTDHLDDLDKQQAYDALRTANLLLSWLPEE